VIAMPDENAKRSAAEIVLELQARHPALCGLAVTMEDVISGAERTMPPKLVATRLHAIAQHVEQYGLEIIARMAGVIAGADRAELSRETFAAWLNAIAQHIEQHGLEMPSPADDDED
jgi:hypothetical protein